MWDDLRKRVNESPTRPPLPHHDDPKRRTKCFLTTDDVTDILQRYEAGETTQQVGTRYDISKTRVAIILREQGVTIRRGGLTDNQISQAATLYAAGHSLARLGARFNVSHTTVAAALKRQGIQLRPRPGRKR